MEKTTKSVSISRSEISKILSNAVDEGYYCVPHAIHELPLTGGEQVTLTALLKIQGDFVKKSRQYGGWFYATSRMLSQYSKKHPSTIKRSTQRLKYMGLIDYRRGTWANRMATQYRVLIDPFYLAQHALANQLKEDTH